MTMKDVVWWKRGVIYQIYPRSFQDTDDDGVGDLAGIERRLDHLVWLGVDALWISPFYPSPMKDFGYDVSDYTGVDPLFGTMADFDRLLGAAHARNLRVILDFVPNHTSDQHPWFLESRSSRTNPRRDWYIWRDPAPGGGPPNNWMSEFGGPAWQWDEATGQYYYHAFLAEQPDLNWRNPEVREAMYAAMRFWLDKGVDGFRVDVMWHLLKDADFRDDPVNPNPPVGAPPHHRLMRVNSADRPEVHAVVREMRAVVDEYPDRLLIGEIYLPNERLVAYYGEDLRGAHLPFNFQLLAASWDPREIAEIVEAYEGALPDGAWPNWVLGNHDRPRVASRVGESQARIAAMLLLTLRGTPTLYYGDELGIENVPIPPDRVHDPYERNVPGLGLGRDPVRTPMQWDDGPFAGFSTVEPWLPQEAEWRTLNVAAERERPGSLLNLYRHLLALRRAEPALVLGEYRLVAATATLLAYTRALGDRRLLIALNMGGHAEAVDIPDGAAGAQVLLCSQPDGGRSRVEGRFVLGPAEGLILALE